MHCPVSEWRTEVSFTYQFISSACWCFSLAIAGCKGTVQILTRVLSLHEPRVGTLGANAATCRSPSAWIHYTRELQN